VNSILRPEVRTDKNGKNVTRHVAVGGTPIANNRVAGAPPAQASPSHVVFSASAFEIVQRTIRPEDLQEARDRVRVDLGNKSEYGWSKLMGSNKNMTQNNIREWHEKLDAVINGDVELQARIFDEAETIAAGKAYGRAYEMKVPTELDEFLDKAWAGEINGFSREKVTENYNRHLELKDKLSKGEISPAKIIGSGYKNPKRIAMEWLDSQIKEEARALETKGRNLSVNISNAKAYKKSLDA